MNNAIESNIIGVDDEDDTNVIEVDGEMVFNPSLSASEETDRYTLEGAEAFIWEQFLKLLNGTEEEVKAIAANRLAMLKTVTETVRENSSLIGAILQMCENFNVSVKYTQVQNLELTEIDLPIVTTGRYSFQIIQVAIGNLYSKFRSLQEYKRERENQLENITNRAKELEAKVKRLEIELSNQRNLPPPPFIVLPFVISRSIVTDDKPIKHVYVTPEFETSSSIANAKRFSTAEKAAKFLVELLQENPQNIDKLHRYQIRSIHYNAVPIESIPTYGADLQRLMKKLGDK